MDNLLSDTYVCRFDDYMDHLLGAPKVETAGILERLMADNIYVKYGDGSGSWAHTPTKFTKGLKYYNPLERACNAICEDEAVVQYKQLEGNGPFAEGIWFDRSQRAPYSLEEGAPATRADLVYLLKSGEKEDYQDLIEKICAVEKKRRDHDARQDANKDESNNKKRKPAESEKANVPVDLDPAEIRSLFLSWLMSIAIFEIKPDETEKKETIIHLTTYMRQILREQHDRRFVFGMILFHNKLSMWYCDRSGLIGTYDPINIHEEPEKIIRVISSLALMTPWELGWDETMKIIPTRGKPMHTHNPTLAPNQLPAKQDQLQWEIAIDGSLFRTIKAISTAQSEIMCGRAPLVWLAVCVNDDIAAEEAKPVVIKQSWRPCGEHSKSEHNLYERVYKNAGSKSMGKVLLHYDQPGTNTLSDFRKGIECAPISNFHPGRIIDDNSKKHGKKQREYIEEPSELNYFTDRYPPRWSQSMEITPRCQYRLVLDTFGWPVKNFKNLRELLTVFLGAIEDYETLYYSGICHRDISIGNIIIDWVTEIGRLIDLDHVKLDETYVSRTIKDFLQIIARYPSLRRNIDKFKSRLQGEVQVDVNYSIAMAHSYSAADSTSPYPFYKAMLEIGFLLRSHSPANGNRGEPGQIIPNTADDKPQDKLPKGDFTGGETADLTVLDSPSGETPEHPAEITAETIGISITEKTILPPQFKGHRGSETFRTGTKAFMSHELLSNSSTIIHKAVHDMESLFWNAVYLCMTRSGPGGKRREEFTTFSGFGKRKPEELSEEEVAHIWKVVQCTYILFENDPSEIYQTKLDMFENPEKLEQHVFPLFHDYFKPLQPLIRAWWNILTLAFPKAPDSPSPVLFCDHIITAFKTALEKAILEFNETQRGYEGQEESVATARKQETEHIKQEVIRLKGLYSHAAESNSTPKSATVQEPQTPEKETILLWTSDLSPPQDNSLCREGMVSTVSDIVVPPAPTNSGSSAPKRAK